MRPFQLHRWDVSPTEAVEIQQHLRSQLDLQSEPEQIETIAGIDVSYDKGSDVLFAAVVVMRVADLRVIGDYCRSAFSLYPWFAVFSRMSRRPPRLGETESEARLSDV